MGIPTAGLLALRRRSGPGTGRRGPRGGLLCACGAALAGALAFGVALGLALGLAVPPAAWAQPLPKEAPPVVDSTYPIGPEDVLLIQVWGRSDLERTVTVDTQGRIQVPLIGELRAEGRTPMDLAKDLTARYQLLDPSVSEVLVLVTAYNARKVTVLGEVRTPGPYGFRAMPDIWDALFTAGGPLPEADLSRVQVIRDQPAEGMERTVTVDLSRGIEGTPSASLPTLSPKDRIVVPSTEDNLIGPGTFHVLGAVRTPGRYRLSVANTVVDALSASGGMLATAQLDKVYLTRSTAEGVVSYKLDIQGYLTKGKPLANLDLLPGDTITVSERKEGRGLLGNLERLLPWASLAITLAVASNN